MRTHASLVLFNAVAKTNWDEDQKMTVYCDHIATIIPDGDFDKVFSAARCFAVDSGVPRDLVLLSLAHIIDQVEAAPDYRGERFEEYVKKLMEASGVSTPTDEKKKPGKTKTGKGRKASGRGTGSAVAVAEKAPTRSSTAAKPRSKPDERPYPFDNGPEIIPNERAEEAGEAVEPAPRPEPVSAKQKFPAGTVQEPPGSSGEPPQVHLVGYLEQPFCDISKQLLALEGPCKDQRLGALMAQQKFKLPDDMELVLDLINGRPKPGVDVFIRKDGRSLTQLPQAVREYTERYEITYNNTTYKVLPPGG